MRAVDDLSRKEIAEMLELTESVVRSHLDEARRSLRTRLNEELE